MLPRRATLIFIFFTLLYTLTNSFRVTVQMPDEEYVLLVTRALVSGRSLALPEEVPKYRGAADTGSDGKVYSAYPIGQSLVYAPFYFVAKQFLHLFEPHDARYHGSEHDYGVWIERETRRWLYVCPTIFAALSCAVFFMFAFRLGYSDATSVLLTLMYGLGTMVWPYSKYLLTEATQNLLLLLTVYLLYVQRKSGRPNLRALIASGAAYGLLCCIRPVFLATAPLLAFYWFYRNEKDRRLVAPIIAFGVPAVAFFAPQLIYDYIRFSSVTALGYGGAGFTTPLYTGLYGFLLSPGKSFFAYAPISILFFFGIRAFRKRAPAEGFLFLMLLILVPLKYAAWWVWSGDPCWGPRYLLVLTPFLLLPAGDFVERIVSAHVWKRACVGALFALSCGIQLLAVSVHYLYYLHYVHRSGSLIPASYLSKSPVTEDGDIPIRDRYIETEFNPEYSPLAGQWWLVKSLLTGAPKPALSAPWAGLGFAQLHEDVLPKAEWDLWVLNLFQGGIQWAKIKFMFGALALVLLLSIVGEELFRAVFFRPPQGGD